MKSTVDEAADSDGIVVPLRGDPPSRRSSAVPVGERVAALVLLAVFAPVLLIVAVSALCSAGRPLLSRSGADGALRFRIAASAQHTPHEGGGLRVVAAAPPRARTGRLLRRSGLDQLPRLLDVARGRARLFPAATAGPRP